MLLFCLYRSEPPAPAGDRAHSAGSRDERGMQPFSPLSSFLAAILALKATDFTGFPVLRCLFSLPQRGKATDFGVFLNLRCLLSFLPAVKATDFTWFPVLRCLFSSSAPAAKKSPKGPKDSKKARNQQFLCWFRALTIAINQKSKPLTNSIHVN